MFIKMFVEDEADKFEQRVNSFFTKLGFARAEMVSFDYRFATDSDANWYSAAILYKHTEEL